MSWLGTLRADAARLEAKVDRILAGQQSIDEAVAAFNAFLPLVSDLVADIRAGDFGGQVDTTKLDAVTAQVPGLQAAVQGVLPGATSTSTSSTGTSSSSSAAG